MLANRDDITELARWLNDSFLLELLLHYVSTFTVVRYLALVVPVAAVQLKLDSHALKETNLLIVFHLCVPSTWFVVVLHDIDYYTILSETLQKWSI